MEPALNPIDVIETAYSLEGTKLEWLRELAAAVRQVIDGGCGLVAYLFDPTLPSAEALDNKVAFDMSDDKLRLVEEVFAANAKLIGTFHQIAEPLDSSAVNAYRRAGLGDVKDVPWIMDMYRRLGVADYSVFRTVEPGGQSVMFVAGQKEERRHDLRTRRLWARVAAHLSAARRLRASVTADLANEAEAVLSPSGKLEHAEGETKSPAVREKLRAAVLRQELARGRERRRDPALATEAWTALVDGRWSLVDRFERGGRRYIVARRNEHALPDPRALTSRERAVVHLAALGKANKLIAYELGLAESTVGTHLAAAMRKLGVMSRVDLIRQMFDTPEG